MIVKYIDNSKEIWHEMMKPDYETIKNHFFGTKKRQHFRRRKASAVK